MEDIFIIVFILCGIMLLGIILASFFDKDYKKDQRILELENMALQENLAFEKKYIKTLEKRIKHLEEIIKLNEKQEDNMDV